MPSVDEGRLMNFVHEQGITLLENLSFEQKSLTNINMRSTPVQTLVKTKVNCNRDIYKCYMWTFGVGVCNSIVGL